MIQAPFGVREKAPVFETCKGLPPRSSLFLVDDLSDGRRKIREFASEQYSWDKVSAITTGVYESLSEKKS